MGSGEEWERGVYTGGIRSSINSHAEAILREFRAKERAQKSKVENKLALTLQNGGMFGFTFFILQYLFHFISDVTTS